MINAVAVSKDKVIITIKGKTFEEDLERFKKDVLSMNRVFDGQKFIVKNAGFVKVDYIQRALADFDRQMRLL
jgi:hypothetical protein